jgi:hypothetical protein
MRCCWDYPETDRPGRISLYIKTVADLENPKKLLNGIMTLSPHPQFMISRYIKDLEKLRAKHSQSLFDNFQGDQRYHLSLGEHPLGTRNYGRKASVAFAYEATSGKTKAPGIWNPVSPSVHQSNALKWPQLMRRFFHFLAKAERSHVGPHFFDVGEAFFLGATLPRVPPAQSVCAIGGPDRVLFLMVDNCFVKRQVFLFFSVHLAPLSILPKA